MLFNFQMGELPASGLHQMWVQQNGTGQVSEVSGWAGIRWSWLYRLGLWSILCCGTHTHRTHVINLCNLFVCIWAKSESKLPKPPIASIAQYMINFVNLFGFFCHIVPINPNPFHVHEGKPNINDRIKLISMESWYSGIWGDRNQQLVNCNFCCAWGAHTESTERLEGGQWSQWASPNLRA